MVWCMSEVPPSHTSDMNGFPGRAGLLLVQWLPLLGPDWGGVGAVQPHEAILF